MHLSAFCHRLLLGLGACAALPALLPAQPTSYFYAGDTLPTVGTYAGWFTTVGPGHPTGSYFTDTTWSSDGDVLTMNTSYNPSEGIWFGRTGGYGDPSDFSLADTADGNLVRARLALAPGSGEWSLYWYDTDGYGSSFYLLADGFHYAYYEGAGYVDAFQPVADMNAFHTFTSYVLAGQVAYFVDGTYLGGGGAIPSATTNFLLLGDGSATNVSGYGSLLVDSLEIITSVGASAPSIAGTAVPEPSTTGALLGFSAFAFTALLRRRRCIR